jgi:hypothetical protein
MRNGAALRADVNGIASESHVLVPLYAVTMFLAAMLLFVLEPLAAKALLPVLGGGAAVWITAVAFFQVALLAGYGYAHLGPSWLGTRRHALLHVGLCALVVLLCPVRPPTGWIAPAQHQSAWLFGRLALSIGPAFVLLAATAPLVQRWLASTDHRHAGDPFFLYVASNAGSMLALLAYPVLLEPLLGLERQRRLWNGTLIVVIGLLGACAAWAARHARAAAATEATTGETVQAPARPAASRISWRTRGRWLALAAVPSSLLLSLTTYVTTDLMAMPLLWVVPLALYLGTFIIAFGRHAPKARRVALVQPFLLLPLAVEMFLGASNAVWQLIPVHVAAFFVTALCCHQELAESRPSGEQSTDFYLWIAAGGALGGLCNVFLAPLLFKGVTEYPVGLVAAALLRPALDGGAADPRRARLLDLAVPALLGAALLAGSLGAQALGARLGGRVTLGGLGVLLTVAGVVGYATRARPLRFGLTLAAIMLVGAHHGAAGSTVLYEIRSFYAVHKVAQDPPALRYLVHGNTLHGVQDLTPERRRQPMAYFHRSGPIGGVMAAFAGWPQRKRVGVAGLGVGTLAAYAAPGEHWTFFEIDEAVLDIARDRGLFTYLSDAEGRIDYVVGDARLTLAAVPDGSFGMLILDAFSSDSVPAHLLTREALELYVRKLAPRGLLAFQLSNRYLDLEPVVAGSAAALGLTALARYDRATDAEKQTGKSSSFWVVVARAPVDLAPVARDDRWHPARVGRGWTDDASNLWRAFHLAH